MVLELDGICREKSRQRVLGFRPEDPEEEQRKAIEDVILEHAGGLPFSILVQMADLIYDRLRSRFGVLEPLLRDERIQEIMINGPDEIYIEDESGIHKSALFFASREELEEVIRTIAAGVRREINERNPILDAHLPDGSRVNAVFRNIAHEGPALTIRKFRRERITMVELVKFGTLTGECAEFLQTVVTGGCNLFISGGTSSGKTTFLNALTEYIPREERVIIIEDSQELMVDSIPNVVQMECHTTNMLGEGKVGMDQLIRTSLRMRPDRILVGEVRGTEAKDMLQAMNTGHDGMSTGHANSVSGMLRRLEAMCLMEDGTPLSAIAAQIVEGLDLMVHLTRCPDGCRRVTEVQELVGYRDGEYVLNPLFLYEAKQGLVRTGNTLQGAKFRTRLAEPV